MSDSCEISTRPRGGLLRARLFLAVFTLVLVAGTLAATVQPTSAAVIGLTAPAAGTVAPGDVIDLTVSFDPNGSAATNIVGVELYVAFAGLVPVPGSWALGAVFTPFLADLLSIDGLCADLGCSVPPGDPFSPQHYLSLVSVFAPSAPTGPGSLFTLQFTAAPGATDWTLDLLGDEDVGLLWDPPPQDCDPNDLDCDPDPAIAPIPFAIVLPNTVVDPGIAKVIVDVTKTTPPPPPTAVPEPATLVLFGAGLLALAARTRRRR